MTLFGPVNKTITHVIIQSIQLILRKKNPYLTPPKETWITTANKVSESWSWPKGLYSFCKRCFYFFLISKFSKLPYFYSKSLIFAFETFLTQKSEMLGIFKKKISLFQIIRKCLFQR